MTVTMEPCPIDDKARTGEVGQIGQIHTCKKAYEIRKLANLANFFDVRWASTPLYAHFRNSTRLHRCCHRCLSTAALCANNK